MGRKKKFIDKKKSATFQLLARDSSDANASSDRVFVRVDNNPFASQGFLEGEDENFLNGIPETEESNSIFADAPDDIDSDNGSVEFGALRCKGRAQESLPEHVRREILELGLPDDGYNYLLHLREIKHTGAGSAFYHNSKAKLDRVPLDVKAYDASRVRVNLERSDDVKETAIYNVAERTVGAKIQKVVDPEVVALLDETDSRFASDDELEEDFVVQANLPDEAEPSGILQESELLERSHERPFQEKGGYECHDFQVQKDESEDELSTDKPRVRRLLDEQFDLLAQREYDSDYDTNDFRDPEDEPLAAKLGHALQDFRLEELELSGKYKVPADFLHGDQVSIRKEEESLADVISKCRAYAEMCEDDNENMAVVDEESSDESEKWDCETIVSTYSTLDNHPKKIEAPLMPKKRLINALSGDPAKSKDVISLRGKEKLPVEYLPQSKRIVQEKVKKVANVAQEQKCRVYSEESKDEKKDRKAAVKAQRREARRAKKDLKGLYKSEAQLAQKVAATAGPVSVHIT